MTETRQSPKTALVLGGTGAVGRALVRELLLSGAFEKVTTLGRRPVSLEDSGLSEEALRRLEQRVVDFERLDENAEAFNHHDVVFCSLGTTRKQAGSAKAFIRIDQDYVVHAAELAHKAGAKHFSYVSSTGANAKSWF
jgi:oxidoreductase